VWGVQHDSFGTTHTIRIPLTLRAAHILRRSGCWPNAVTFRSTLWAQAAPRPRAGTTRSTETVTTHTDNGSGDVKPIVNALLEMRSGLD
jgi:hypothetical protein